MNKVKRPLPFVLVSTNHGSLIVNRNDYRMIDGENGYGVGFQLLNTSSFDQEEVDFVLALLNKRRDYFGDPVVAIDCGANIGVHTVEWARFMHGWGIVYSFEAQEKIFYALAGNVAINNCLNVVARHFAVGSRCSTIRVPKPNYFIPSSFGSLEIVEKGHNENIGQLIDYSDTQEVPLISVDSLSLENVGLIKIDVEGMEEDVLAGAVKTITNGKPILVIETIKSDTDALHGFLNAHEYLTFPMGINILAVHRADPIAAHLTIKDGVLHLDEERISE